MENVKWKDVLIQRLQDIFDDVKWANSLIESGKEVPADRKLQGVRAKMVTLMEGISKEMPDDFVLNAETSENVAKETSETQ